MKNSTAYEKTFLGLGLLLGELLRREFGVHGYLDAQSTPLFARVIRTVLFFGIFTKVKVMLVAAIGPLTGNLKYLPLVVQPVLLLFVFPCFAHALKLGNFFGSVPVSAEKKKKIQ